MHTHYARVWKQWSCLKCMMTHSRHTSAIDAPVLPLKHKVAFADSTYDAMHVLVRLSSLLYTCRQQRLTGLARAA